MSKYLRIAMEEAGVGVNQNKPFDSSVVTELATSIEDRGEAVLQMQGVADNLQQMITSLEGSNLDASMLPFVNTVVSSVLAPIYGNSSVFKTSIESLSSDSLVNDLEQHIEKLTVAQESILNDLKDKVADYFGVYDMKMYVLAKRLQTIASSYPRTFSEKTYNLPSLSGCGYKGSNEFVDILKGYSDLVTIQENLQKTLNDNASTYYKEYLEIARDLTSFLGKLANIPHGLSILSNKIILWSFIVSYIFAPSVVVSSVAYKAMQVTMNLAYQKVFEWLAEKNLGEGDIKAEALQELAERSQRSLQKFYDNTLKAIGKSAEIVGNATIEIDSNGVFEIIETAKSGSTTVKPATKAQVDSFVTMVLRGTKSYATYKKLAKERVELVAKTEDIVSKEASSLSDKWSVSRHGGYLMKNENIFTQALVKISRHNLSVTSKIVEAIETLSEK